MCGGGGYERVYKCNENENGDNDFEEEQAWEYGRMWKE